MDALTGKKIGPLEEIKDPLDTAATAYYAEWAPDSSRVAITYRADRHIAVTIVYRIANRRAYLVTEADRRAANALAMEIEVRDVALVRKRRPGQTTTVMFSRVSKKGIIVVWVRTGFFGAETATLATEPSALFGCRRGTRSRLIFLQRRDRASQDAS
jgi:hypothetical protein